MLSIRVTIKDLPPQSCISSSHQPDDLRFWSALISTYMKQLLCVGTCLRSPPSLWCGEPIRSAQLYTTEFFTSSSCLQSFCALDRGLSLSSRHCGQLGCLIKRPALEVCVSITELCLDLVLIYQFAAEKARYGSVKGLRRVTVSGCFVSGWQGRVRRNQQLHVWLQEGRLLRHLNTMEQLMEGPLTLENIITINLWQK